MIHIFDIDDTIIKKTSMWYFLLEAFKERLVKFSQVRRLPFDWLKYKLGSPDMDFIEKTVNKLDGIDKTALERAAAACFEKRMKKVIYSEAARLIREAHEKKERVIFATSSIDVVIQPLERFFGIEKALATELEFKDGETTGRVVGNSYFGKKKKDAALAWLEKNGLNVNEASFYSDSYTDIPLLEVCAVPVAVNPDRILRREAKKRGWRILRFRHCLGK
jgi:HAD superfamily hydrolase (TIGR01490 family)